MPPLQRIIKPRWIVSGRIFNLQSYQIKQKYYHRQHWKAIRILELRGKVFDVIFMDPPYNKSA